MFRIPFFLLFIAYHSTALAEYSFGLSPFGGLDNVDPVVSISMQPPDSVMAEAAFAMEILMSDLSSDSLRTMFWRVNAQNEQVLLDSLELPTGVHGIELVLPEGDFRIRTLLRDSFGNTGEASSEWIHSFSSTAILNSPLLPQSFSMRPAFPNPFNPVTTISFSIPGVGDVRFRVANLTGSIVHLEDLASLRSGVHMIQWDAGAFASGIYIALLEWRGEIRSQKVLVIK